MGAGVRFRCVFARVALGKPTHHISPPRFFGGVWGGGAPPATTAMGKPTAAAKKIVFFRDFPKAPKRSETVDNGWEWVPECDFAVFSRVLRWENLPTTLAHQDSTAMGKPTAAAKINRNFSETIDNGCANQRAAPR